MALIVSRHAAQATPGGTSPTPEMRPYDPSRRSFAADIRSGTSDWPPRSDSPWLGGSQLSPLFGGVCPSTRVLHSRGAHWDPRHTIGQAHWRGVGCGVETTLSRERRRSALRGRQRIEGRSRSPPRGSREEMRLETVDRRFMHALCLPEVTRWAYADNFAAGGDAFIAGGVDQ